MQTTHVIVSLCVSLVDVLDLLMSNPQVQQFLTSLSMTITTEAGGQIGKWVVSSIGSKIKSCKLFKNDKIGKTEKLLNDLISKKSEEITLFSNYWIEFLTFMFPDREVSIDKLTMAECDYIAQRILTGLGFEQLVLETGYKSTKIRYMTHFSGLQSNALYYFDITAGFEQEYFDNFLFGRVIDTRVSSPQEFINSIPAAVSDINGDPARPAQLRDHDIITMIIPNDLTSSRLAKLRQTIRTVQERNPFIPRLVLMPNQEFSELLACTNPEERKERMRRKFQDVRLYRGVIE